MSPKQLCLYSVYGLYLNETSLGLYYNLNRTARKANDIGISNTKLKMKVQLQICTIGLLDSWLKKVGTDNSPRQCLAKYVRMPGEGSMMHVARGNGARFEKLA